MLVDYSVVRAAAEKLLKDYGRKIIARKLSDGNQENLKPWAGVVSLNNTAYQETEFYAVAINASNSKQFLGISNNMDDLLAKCSKVFLVSAKEADEADLSYFTHIVDEEKELRINFVEKLKPGNVALLYYIGATEI